jgi:hypothetical protein
MGKSGANGNDAGRSESPTNSQERQNSEAAISISDEKAPQVEVSSQSSEHASEQDAVVYLSGIKLAFLTLALIMSLFVVALDTSIIATAIPKITTVFDSLDDVGWYATFHKS